MKYEQFSGLRNNTTSDRFSPTDLRVALNVDIDDSLRVSRRCGSNLLYAGVTHSVWSQDDLCFFIEGTTLKQLLPDMTTVNLFGGMSLGLPTRFARIGDRVYFSNAHEAGVIDNGIVRSWGLSPPMAFAAQAIDGNLSPGKYQYTMTFVRNDGQESGARDAGLIETDGGIAFDNLPVSTDSTVAQKILYLSAANGEGLYEAVVLPNLQASVSIVDEYLGSALETQHMRPCPVGQEVAYHYGRLYVAQGSYLYPSVALSYELFNLLDFVQFEDRVTMIAPVERGLFIGTDTETGFITGTNPDDFVYRKKADYGVYPGTLASVGAHLLGFEDADGESVSPVWTSAQGICCGMPSGEIYNLTDPRYRIAQKTALGGATVRVVDGSAQYIVSFN